MPFSKPDLHSHTLFSDGTDTPTELVNKAVVAGISSLAITDHDTVEGIPEAQTAAQDTSLNLIPGIECSVQFDQRPFHIVGLNIDIHNSELNMLINQLNQTREERAINIDKELAKSGIENTYEETRQLAGESQITRSHFAQVLIKRGLAKDTKSVFKKFLVKNKPGYVKAQWPEMQETIQILRNAGGTVVMAHPMRYKINKQQLNDLLNSFKNYGGEAMEVITASHDHAEIRKAANIAKKVGLLASIGSDYHGELHPWIKLGHLATLRNDISPVWENGRLN